MADPQPDNATFNARIVYWGIDGAGKRSSLSQVARKLRSDHRGDIREVPTRIDPTVSYTVLPIELGDIGGVRTRIEIVAVPGDPQQEPTRKQLLDRADGIVFVADSQRQCIDANLASIEELRKGLHAYARSIEEMPFMVQYNKRDLSDPYVIDELHRRLGVGNATVFESNATDGTGILQALSTISKKVIRALRDASQPMDAGRPALETEVEKPATPPLVTPLSSEEPPLLDPEASFDEDPGLPLGAGPEELEAAIVATERHPEADEIATELRGVESMLAGPGLDDLDQAEARGVRVGADMSIVSVGTATRDDDRTLRVPIVLGDGDGETSTLVLSIRLDPLLPDAED